MKFDAEMKHHIQAKKIFKRLFLIKMFYSLFAMSFNSAFLNSSPVIFFNFACNISNYKFIIIITQT